MKRLLKRVLKPIWRSTASLRRPILARVERFLRHCLQPVDGGQPHPLNQIQLNKLNEIDVLMDHVIRELVRLQCQVEALQQTIVELLPAPQEVPAIAGEIEPRATTDERLKAG
jgi:hypothetical protein